MNKEQRNIYDKVEKSLTDPYFLKMGYCDYGVPGLGLLMKKRFLFPKYLGHFWFNSKPFKTIFYSKNREGRDIAQNLFKKFNLPLEFYHDISEIEWLKSKK